MEYFAEIPDAAAIIRQRGFHQQVPLFRRGRKIYAKVGTRFVRLMPGNSSSVPTISWLEMDMGGTDVVTEGLQLLIAGAEIRVLSK